MKNIALALIRCYQRWLSPRKAYCCAYRHYTGAASCSNLGYRAIRRYELWRGWQILRERLQRCGVAYRRYHAQPRRKLAQAGFCDAGCDLPCDGNITDACECACDVPGECGDSRRKNQEETIHIPPNKRESI